MYDENTPVVSGKEEGTVTAIENCRRPNLTGVQTNELLSNREDMHNEEARTEIHESVVQMLSQNEGGKGPESEAGHLPDTGKQKRRWRHWTEEDAKRWEEKFVRERKSITQIAADDEVDPKIVSVWLHKLGVDVYAGLHRIDREPPKLTVELSQLLAKGPDEVLKFIDRRVWGVSASPDGLKQLTKFCQFLKLPLEVGVKAVAKGLKIDRSMVGAWTEGTKQPYLVRVANTAVQTTILKEGWKLLPLHLVSGGNEQGPWIQVPVAITDYEDITTVIGQLTPLEVAYQRGSGFGLSRDAIQEMRPALLGYLLAIMVGDAGKAGGQQERFASMNLDVQFTRKRISNARLGDFICLCTNTLGLEMNSIKDKLPSGTTSFSREPSAAYRWSSERSPVLAWMFSVGLGLKWNETTTTHPVNMNWIFNMPFEFGKRFAQGLADSDGCVKKYVVEITSAPNTEFVTKLLHSVGLKSAYSRIENGIALRSVVRAIEAANLPLVNEFTNGYRYQQLMSYKRN